MTVELPELPLLAPWYRVAEDGARIVFEHAHRAVVLEGAAVRELLPRLLPLLDGTRTLADVAASLGPAAEPAVVKAVTLLAERGLLTAGPAVGGRPELAASAEELAADGGVSPSAAFERLAAARVGIAGTSRVAVEAARLIARSGVGSIHRRELDDRGCDDDLLVAAPAPAQFAAMHRCNELGLESGRPWFQVLPFDGRIAAIGPLFLPGETACHVCYTLRRSANLGFGELEPVVDTQPTRAPVGPVAEQLAAACVASLVLRWIALRDPRLPGVLFALELDGGPLLTRHLVLRVPRCPACSQAQRLAPLAPWFDPPLEAVA